MAKRAPRPGEGRPSKYDPAFIDTVKKYLKENKDTYTEFHKTRGDKSDTYVRLVEVKLPMLEDFARYIGVHKDTLVEWGHRHPEFSVALNEIKEEQRRRLINNGLSGDYNPLIAKLVLSANYGMTERSDITTGGEKINPLLVKFIGDDTESNGDTN